MNIAPCISIIMSVYDGDNISYVKECMHSISNQNFKDFEIIMVDDGITKSDLREFIRNLSLEEPRLRIFENAKNLGLAASMNHAMEKARGKYFARMDSDDIMLPSRLQKQYDFLEQNPSVDIVGSFYIEIDDQKEVINYVTLPLKHEQMVKIFPRRNPLAHVSVMMRKEFIEKSGLYPTNTISDEDTLMWLNGIKNGAIIANISEFLLKVRVSNNFYKRRAGFKKALWDARNRYFVIRDLKLSWFNLTYVCLRFFFQINPFQKLTYWGYKYLRK